MPLLETDPPIPAEVCSPAGAEDPDGGVEMTALQEMEAKYGVLKSVNKRVQERLQRAAADSQALCDMRVVRARELGEVCESFGVAVNDWQTKTLSWLTDVESKAYAAADALGQAAADAAKHVADVTARNKATELALNKQLTEIGEAKRVAIAEAKARAEETAEAQAALKAEIADIRDRATADKRRMAEEKAAAAEALKAANLKAEQERAKAVQAMESAHAKVEAAKRQAEAAAREAAMKRAEIERAHREEQARVEASHRRALDAAAQAAHRAAEAQRVQAAEAQRKAAEETRRQEAVQAAVDSNTILQGSRPKVGGRVVLVIDESSSMTWNSAWSHAVREACSALDVFATLGSQFGLIAFQSHVSCCTSSLQAASPGNISSAKGWLHGRSPNGGTDFDSALQTALLFGAEQIYFLTDAGDSVSHSVQRAVSTGSVQLNCVVINEDSSDLQSLAASTGGTYRRVGAGGGSSGGGGGGSAMGGMARPYSCVPVHLGLQAAMFYSF